MGGIKDSQKMESSFFDALYVMPPLTNGRALQENKNPIKYNAFATSGERT